MFKVNNKDTRTMPDVVLVFLLLTLSKQMSTGDLSLNIKVFFKENNSVYYLWISVHFFVASLDCQSGCVGYS